MHVFGIAAIAGLFSLIGAGAGAVTIEWADWQTANVAAGTAAGQIGGGTDPIDFTFSSSSGPFFFVQTDGGTDYWALNRNSTYSSAFVDNGPPDPDIAALLGGSTNIVYTIAFDRPVKDLVLAMLSMGQFGIPITYEFDQDFVLENAGPGHWGNGLLTRTGPGVLRGEEGHGIIRFTGVFSSFSWTVPTFENWHGIQIGIQRAATQQEIEETFGVPAPAAAILLATGLLAILRRRA